VSYYEVDHCACGTKFRGSPPTVVEAAKSSQEKAQWEEEDDGEGEIDYRKSTGCAKHVKKKIIAIGLR